MQFSSRLPMAVHVLLAIDYFEGQYRTTSAFLADSVGTNPVIIRRLLSQLQKAELIKVKAGEGGASLCRSLDDISLLDIYKAVEKPGEELFHFHDDPSPACPVGRNIHTVLDPCLEAVQNALEAELRRTVLADLKAGIGDLLNKETDE